MTNLSSSPDRHRGLAVAQQFVRAVRWFSQ